MTKITLTAIFALLCWKVSAAPGDTDKVVCDEIRATAESRCENVSTEDGEQQICYTENIDELVSEYNDNTSDLLDEELTCDYE